MEQLKGTLMFTAGITMVLLLSFCEREKKVSLKHLKTSTIIKEKSKKKITTVSSNLNGETLYELQNDSLIIKTGFSYACSSPLNTTYKIVYDTIKMIIIDECTPFNSPCYSNTSCRYTIEYIFTGLDKYRYIFQSIFHDGIIDSVILLDEGIIKNIH
ncbi:MAG: hypothetical protein ACOCUL_00960 [Bacteroidota bacterium]